MSETYNADVEKVKRVQFSLLSPEHVRNRSVVEITKERIYDGGGIPCAGGLFDRKMGVLESGVTCTTDDLNKQDCPGYFGHIELAMPVFYVQFVSWIKGVLESVCFRCGCLRINREFRKKELTVIRNISGNATRYTMLTKLIKDDRNNCMYCPSCNARQPDKYSYEKEDLQFIAHWSRRSEDPASKEIQHSRVLMTPEYVQMLFKRLPDEDCMLIGFDPKFSRPEWMICSVLPVAPPSVRPSVKKEGQQPRSEDDLTHKYIDIIKCNKMLKQKLSVLSQQQNATTSSEDQEQAAQVNSRMVESWRYILQYHVATLIDNECGVNKAQQRSGRPLKAIRQRLKSKEGRIRGNLMGKRVDFSARTVITPDPLLKLDELGVPLDMCTNMTFPEKVNPFNIERLRRMVRNGTEKYPGARIIDKANGRKLSLKFFTTENNYHLLNEKALSLQVGDTVHRHLLDGDPVLFNRQPSLHKMSMMCHKVKPMKIGKTFRLSVDTTTPYNADFDGDEMNMHIPQSMEAATELRCLAAVHQQIIGPALAKPCLAPVQDTMLGAHLMSKDSSAFHRRHFMNTLLWTSKTWNDLMADNCVPTQNVVSGKQAYSAILPNNLNIDMGKNQKGEHNLLIESGSFKEGIVVKSSFKAQSKGLIHVAFQDCGATVARDLIDDVRGVVTSYMYNRGFSVGISDLEVPTKIKSDIEQVIQDVHKKVETDLQELYSGTLNNTTRLCKADLIERMVSNNTTKINDTVGDAILQTSGCRFKDMVTSGSKGNKTNISQMIGCVGQQSIEGKRVMYNFEDRTLPHFSKYDDSLQARGFVDNSYLNGLTPHEFFFHAMGGRVGLIDTAVKTAQTGYIQRKLVKSMEDLRAENDETVRNANGRIVNLIFGEDGMDSAKLEKQTVPFAGRDAEIVEMYLGKHYTEKDKKTFLTYVFYPSVPIDKDILTHQGMVLKTALQPANIYSGLPVVNYFRDIVCKGLYSTHNVLSYPVHLQRVVCNVIAELKKKTTKPKPETKTFLDCIHSIESLLQRVQFAKDPEDPNTSLNPSINIFRVLLYSTLLQYDVRQNLLKNGVFEFTLSKIEKLFYSSKVHSGEMVGVIAAQSIGEPATQMTLNTFHFAGVSAKSKVTQGVPRLKEILTMTKNPKSATLVAYLEPQFNTKKDATMIRNIMEITTLRDITSATSIYYDPNVNNYGTMLEEDKETLQYQDALQQSLLSPEEDEKPEPHPNHWVIRIELDNEQMYNRQLRVEDIYSAMKSLHGEDIEVQYSDDNAKHLVIRVRINKYSDSLEQMDDYYLLKMLETNLLDNVVLRGISNVHNIVIDTEVISSTFVKNSQSGKYEYKEKEQYVLYCEGTKEGTNLLEVLIHPAVDSTRTLCDHITEVHEVLGIEATREIILREIYKVIKESSNEPPSRRHIMLLADTMTSLGKSLISIDRNGIKRSDIGPLARCSFEETDKQLYQAAIFGEYDNVQGVSANIMLGQVASCGTGMVNVLFDEDEFIRLQKSFQSDEKGIDNNWEKHVEKWENDMQGMLHMQQQMNELADEELPVFKEDELQFGTGDNEEYNELSQNTHLTFDYTDDMLDEM